MKALFAFLFLFTIVFGQILTAQNEDFNLDESCTCIVAGEKATTDGSVITSHTCDGNYRTWLNIVPAKTHKKDEIVEIYKGGMHTETPWDTRGLEKRGEIPQVKETYAFLNTAYPCLNEKQLAIGESTISGRKEMKSDKGMFLIENLEAIVLQRCTTAREAIKLMGELVKEYGYCDAGECLCIADKKEVWIFEIFGPGEDKVGAVWAAQRIPNDHVGVCANISRIGELDLKNKDYYMASDNVYDLAKDMGFWDGEETFKFWKAYSGAKPFQIREYFILSSVAPSLDLQYDADELPFSVKPDEKISVRDVMALLRSTFEGTEWDMTQNLKMRSRNKDSEGNVYYDTIVSPYANPWMRGEMMGMLNYQHEGAVKFNRTCAVAWCSYSFVAQLRDDLPDEFGGVAWFAFDNPGQSPRIPIFCGTMSLPESFNYSGQFDFNSKSAHWQYRQANRLATVKYGEGRKLIEPALMEYETKAFDEIAFVQEHASKLLKEDQKSHKSGEPTHLCQDYLTQYTADFYGMTAQRWLELRDEFWTKFRFSF